MMKCKRHHFLYSGGTLLSLAGIIALGGFQRGSDATARLQNFHRNVMRLAAPVLLRMVQAGHEGRDLKKFTQANLDARSVPHPDVVYDYVDKMAEVARAREVEVVVGDAHELTKTELETDNIQTITA